MSYCNYVKSYKKLILLTSLFTLTQMSPVSSLDQIQLADAVATPAFLGAITNFSSAKCWTSKSKPKVSLEIRKGSKWEAIGQSSIKSNTAKCPGKNNFEINYRWRIENFGSEIGKLGFGNLILRERRIDRNEIIYSQINLYFSRSRYAEEQKKILEAQTRAEAEAVAKAKAEAEAAAKAKAEAEAAAKAKAEAEAKLKYDARVKELVRTLYYDLSIAGRNSKASQDDFVIKNNYPGFINNEIVLSCFAKSRDLVTSSEYTPNIETLSPDPNWAPTVTKDDIAGGINWENGKKPIGDTYILTIEQTYSNRQTLSSPWVKNSSKAQAHVTILNDRAYFYFYCIP